jgi:hypothetical protein
MRLRECDVRQLLRDATGIRTYVVPGVQRTGVGEFEAVQRIEVRYAGAS